MYRVKQYGIHLAEYQVEADSEAEAIAEVLNGNCMLADNGVEFVEVDNTHGMPVENHRDLADQIVALGMGRWVNEHMIGSIESVEED